MTTTAVNLKLHPYDVLVARPSRWGNPYMFPRDGTKKMVLDLYRKWLRAKPELVTAARVELKGKRLGCHCLSHTLAYTGHGPDLPEPQVCHAQILAQVAEGAEP